MKLVFINQTKQKLPKKHLQEVLNKMLRYAQKKGFKTEAAELVLVFLPPTKARKLNHQFRQKDYATDVLSFSSEDPSSFGELVFCPDVLKKQAKDHDLTFKWELTYMLIHGILHLFGLDHENSPAEAKKMFNLQDTFFATLR